MPEVQISVGGRVFVVACQDGEEHYLEAAARLLDVEASELANQAGRLPEARMLLMAGLMLADKTAALEDKVARAESDAAALRAHIEEMQVAQQTPERVEVPVIPQEVTENMAELAARAEALADLIERQGER